MAAVSGKRHCTICDAYQLVAHVPPAVDGAHTVIVYLCPKCDLTASQTPIQPKEKP